MVGEWAVYYNIKKNTWISWIHPMRVLAAYVSSERQISITQMTKQKKHNNNTKFIVLDSWLGVLLAAPGVRIGGGPPSSGRAVALFIDNNGVQ